MQEKEDKFEVQIYYEDTDHSGFVYHANYLKYCERAREHFIGVDQLIAWYKDKINFAISKAQMEFIKGAQFGDTLLITTTVKKTSKYSLLWDHIITKKDSSEIMTKIQVELLCISDKKKLMVMPEF